MKIDEQIKLAEQIAQNLPKVTRGEWNKWVQMAERYGLDTAIQHAQRMAKDVTLRPNIKQANDALGNNMGRYKSTLKKIDTTTQKTIWGYVANFLKTKEKAQGA